MTVSMLGDVLFDVDKYTIRPTAEPTLLEIVRVINSTSAGNVSIEGHTDAKGLGDTKPLQPNTLANGADNPKGRAQNRRVEFVLPKN